MQLKDPVKPEKVASLCPPWPGGPERQKWELAGLRSVANPVSKIMVHVFDTQNIYIKVMLYRPSRLFLCI